VDTHSVEANTHIVTHTTWQIKQKHR